MPDLTTYGGWAVAILGIVAGVVAAIWPKRGTLEHQLIDQLQEQITNLQSRVDRLDSERDTRNEYIKGIERENREWRVILTQIQVGILNGTIPPWPDLVFPPEGEKK